MVARSVGRSRQVPPECGGGAYAWRRLTTRSSRARPAEHGGRRHSPWFHGDAGVVPGQSYWLSLFVDDMIAGTGLGRTAFSVVYAAATVFSAAIVLALGVVFLRRGPAQTWVVVAVALAVGSLLMSFASGAVAALVALAMLRAFGQGSFPLLGTSLVAQSADPGAARRSRSPSRFDAGSGGASACGRRIACRVRVEGEPSTHGTGRRRCSAADGSAGALGNSILTG